MERETHTLTERERERERERRREGERERELTDGNRAIDRDKTCTWSVTRQRHWYA